MILPDNRECSTHCFIHKAHDILLSTKHTKFHRWQHDVFVHERHENAQKQHFSVHEVHEISQKCTSCWRRVESCG